MKQESHTLRFGILAFAGILLFCAAVSDVVTTPASEACNSNPNCSAWNVERWGCEWFCNCGQQQMPHTCYTEEGTCNSGGTAVLFVVAIKAIVAVPAATAQAKVLAVEVAVVAAEVPRVATTVGRSGIVTLVANVAKALAMRKRTFPSVVMRASSD